MAKNIAIGLFKCKINGIDVNTSIKSNSGNYTNKTSRNIKYIVFHYTGNKKDTAKNNALYFKNNDVNVSAHFFVDDTSIYQSVELTDVAWHCGTKGKYYHSKCRNDNSIGIEMCCTAGNYRISDKTVGNAAFLGASLCELLNIKADEVDTYCLRHYDVTHKNCPAQMVTDANEWKSLKTAIKTILRAKEKKADATTAKPTTSTTTTKASFLPARGYFKKGDNSANVGKIASFMRKAFPAYTPAAALGNYYGDNLIKAVKEFQKRSGLEPDGYFGKLTLAALKKHGFKE